MKYSFSLIALMISTSVLSTLALHSLIDRPTPTFVSVDVKSTLDAYHQELVKKNLSLEEQTERLAYFADTLHDVIAEYNARHNTIVLVSAAVVGGAVDITPQIQTAIVERYQQKE